MTAPIKAWDGTALGVVTLAFRAASGCAALGRASLGASDKRRAPLTLLPSSLRPDDAPSLAGLRSFCRALASAVGERRESALIAEAARLKAIAADVFPPHLLHAMAARRRNADTATPSVRACGRLRMVPRVCLAHSHIPIARSPRSL